MEKVEIGDYVRTKRGLICRIININEFREPCMKYGIEASYLDDIWFIGDDDIKLVKEKPIDLIERNDLVVDNYGNIYVADYLFDNYVYTTTKQANIVKTLCDYQIESIVTHEQFESMKYKLINQDLELDMLKALNQDLDDDVEMG